jgi:hypothetical protein
MSFAVADVITNAMAHLSGDDDEESDSEERDALHLGALRRTKRRCRPAEAGSGLADALS